MLCYKSMIKVVNGSNNINLGILIEVPLDSGSGSGRELVSSPIIPDCNFALDSLSSSSVLRLDIALLSLTGCKPITKPPFPFPNPAN